MGYAAEANSDGRGEAASIEYALAPAAAGLYFQEEAGMRTVRVVVFQRWAGRSEVHIGSRATRGQRSGVRIF